MDTKVKIGIVGLGLIGGSIEKKLNQLPGKYSVLSVSESQKRNLNLKDLSDVDILFLCGPQSKIKKQLLEVASLKARSYFSKAIITDVASTKESICRHAKDAGLTDFIGGHPMAGTELQGYENSQQDLFQACTWILTESSPRSKLLEDTIKDLGVGNIVIMDPSNHDKAVAAVSHLPLVLSIGLKALAKEVPQAAKVIGPGFKSMTRLANGNESLSQEIIRFNRDNIKALWDKYKTQVDSFLNIAGAADMEEEIKSVKEVVLAA
jgi:prephenate dehydrogenase